MHETKSSSPQVEQSFKRPHRLALATLPPRAFAFCHTFGLTVWIALVEGRGWWLILPGLLLLLWPLIAFAHAALSRDSKRAEFRNLYADSLLFGIWCGVLDYYLWAMLFIGLACFMNNMVVGGLRRMAVSVGLFGAGAMGWGLLMGFEFRPHISTALDVYQVSGAAVYFLVIASVMYNQNRQIGRSIKEIKYKNRVFQALLDLGVVADRAEDITTLLNDSLAHLHADFPEYGFAVFLQERQRPEVTRYAAMAGQILSSQEERQLGSRLAKLDGLHASVHKLSDGPQGEHLYATSMGGKLSLYEGWLVVRASRLDDALERVLSLFVDQLAAATENKLLHLALQRAAERDGLTGLYNRGFFESALQQSIKGKLQHPQLDFALLMIDVDGLKEVNDRHGHLIGDELITTVAERLQSQCREGDILARYGGDEFVFLFPSADLTAPARLSELIRTHLEGQRCILQSPDGTCVEVKLQLSLGSASSSEVPPQAVLTLADNRMYDDKTHRRQRRVLG